MEELMFLRVSDTPQSYPRLCMYLKLILCSPSPASERLSHLPSAYAQREQLIIYHGGWRFFTTHTNTASKFLTVVQAFRPFRTSDTKLRQKKNQLTKISDVTFQIHATFFYVFFVRRSEKEDTNVTYDQQTRTFPTTYRTVM